MSRSPGYLETQPATAIRVVMGVTALSLLVIIVVVPLPSATRILLAAVGALDLMLAFLLWSMTVEVAGGGSCSAARPRSASLRRSRVSAPAPDSAFLTNSRRITVEIRHPRRIPSRHG